MNENFRARLNKIFKEAKLRFAECLEEAQSQGEVPADLDVKEAADFILSTFEGVLLQMKVSRTTAPQEIFNRMIFERMLKSGSR